ncbi:MAG: hypothetical protein JWP75_3306 [Frondihabitans sp.]|nr:hypothetical protein [Frondihabitans sp.]
MVESGSGGRLSTAERLAREIRQLLYQGELGPGDRLVEEDLATRFGVSRGPIREAIRILSAEGTAVLRRNRGAVISEPSLTDVLEVYAMRRAIGLVALEYGCTPGVISEAQWDDLQDHLERLSSLEVRGNQHRMTEQDLDFQTKLIEATGLRRAAETFRTTARDIRLFVRAFAIPYDPAGHMAIVNMHARLLGAVRSGDVDAARDRWLEHIRLNAEEFTAYFPDDRDALEEDPLMGLLVS